MEQLSAVRSVLGKTYIHDGSDNPDSFWCEGESAVFEIERTDDDEVRVGVIVRGDHDDSVTLYLERSEAVRFMLAIAQAVGDR